MVPVQLSSEKTIQREVFDVPPQKLLLAATPSINGLEASPDSSAADQIHLIIERSRGVFLATADPRGIAQSVDPTEFLEIYRGDGENDDQTPVEQVIDDAISSDLFAVTLGDEISGHIERHFSAGELAEGFILDQIASFAADELAQFCAVRMANREQAGPGIAALPYSPGYCGWHVSGQRRLFSHLAPAEIGISLNDSCLMHPVKSVSGVVIVAPLTAHDFSPAFPCCATCTTLACQDRVAGLKAAIDTE